MFIFWDNAPKEATHATRTGTGNIQWFMLSSEGNWYNFYEVHRGVPGDLSDWQRVYGVPTGVGEFIKRPQPLNPHDAWDGESFPPEGLKVEAMFTTDPDPEWFDFTLYAKGAFNFFGHLRSFDSEHAGHDDTWSNAEIPNMRFRRERTQEERDAEKLAIRIDKISQSLYEATGDIIDDEMLIALIELGYISRKD